MGPTLSPAYAAEREHELFKREHELFKSPLRPRHREGRGSMSFSRALSARVIARGKGA
jgi:hypothetical protein